MTGVPQIRKGKRDNLGIVFHITPLKHVATHHKNRLAEMVLMRGHNICFHNEIRKIIFELKLCKTDFSLQHIAKDQDISFRFLGLYWIRNCPPYNRIHKLGLDLYSFLRCSTT